MSSPFDEERLKGARSALVKITPDAQGRFLFELWAQYTRSGLDAIEVGDLVAVENYTPPQNSKRFYSILTLTQVYPMHFASQGTDAYPGHVFESMRSIKEDWEKQEDKPLHATTTIFIQAVSTGWQFWYDPKQKDLPSTEDERNLPMTGAELRPLSKEMVEAIVNKDLESELDSPFTHRKFDDINVKLDVEALLTTHFGIFGFTGVGKSNLVSSIVSTLSSGKGTHAANVILIDPNDEYLPLLIDKFVNSPTKVYYIHVEGDSLPVPVMKALGPNAESPANAVIETFMGQLKLPPKMDGEAARGLLLAALPKVIGRTRIALPDQDVASRIHDILSQQTDSRAGPDTKEALREAETKWISGFEGVPITIDSVRRAIAVAKPEDSEVRKAIRDYGRDAKRQGTAMGTLSRAVKSLERLSQSLVDVPPDAVLPMNDLVEYLNEESTGKIVIVTGRRDIELKRFATTLGNQLYETRRMDGKREPFVSFIFDEADLFLPQENRDEATQEVRSLCVTLARRGRKFGLGIGISTQRVALLDTEVMGNLHTYFVSKLPRAFDRQRVAEAFGIGEEQLSPTFSFRPGNWLIISHDATGLKGVPIPTSAQNAVVRILSGARSG